MEDARLTTSIDAAGNLFGLRAGMRELPPLVLGSHSDTVANGGWLDGALGVLGALEVVRSLAEDGVALERPLLVADYLAEEANDFGVSCVGSRALTHGLDAAWLARRLGDTTLADAIAACGGDPSLLADGPLWAAGRVHACLELHIEQGPVLEADGIALGAVSGIVGIRRSAAKLTGRPDHAGTAPMGRRHDALAAAAESILMLERLAGDMPGTVGTVGHLLVSPNQGNVVPGVVRLTAEMRSLDSAEIERLWHDWRAATVLGCQRRGVDFIIETTTDAAPATPPPWLLEEILAACRSIDRRAAVLPSGAGHDSGHLALVAPAGMIFVPSIGGRSHCPEEDTAPEHLAAGVEALHAAAQRLARA